MPYRKQTNKGVSNINKHQKGTNPEILYVRSGPINNVLQDVNYFILIQPVLQSLDLFKPKIPPLLSLYGT